MVRAGFASLHARTAEGLGCGHLRAGHQSCGAPGGLQAPPGAGQLTAAGHAAHDSILRVLGAAELAGSLQRSMFRNIRENPNALTPAVDATDSTATCLRMRSLDGALRDLAASASDFHSTVAELRRETELAPERFLAYKHLLINTSSSSSTTCSGTFPHCGAR